MRNGEFWWNFETYTRAYYSMLSVLEIKKLIMSEKNSIPDEEIQALRDSLYQIANVAFKFWEKEKLKKT